MKSKVFFAVLPQDWLAAKKHRMPEKANTDRRRPTIS
jgi:hypothetical protein